MEERQTLPRPGDEAADPEVFQRVWDRVMAGRNAGASPPVLRADAEPDENALDSLVRELRQGMALLLSLLPQGGGREWKDAAALLRRTARELEANRFLLCGSMQRETRPMPEISGAPGQRLRTLYRWGIDWALHCRALAERAGDPLLVRQLRLWAERGETVAETARNAVTWPRRR